MTVRVNGDTIPESAIQFELARLVKFYASHMAEEQIRSQMDALKKKAVEQAIGAKLLIERANDMDIRVPADDLDERIEEMAERSGGREGLAKAMQEQGITEQDLRKSLERGRRVDLLIDQITADVPEPTEDDMKDHFEVHMHEYRRPDRAQAQHILVSAASDSVEDRATAKSKLLEIRERVQEGATFAHEAAAHSECPSGAKAGGSLGWFSRGMMVPEFDAAVFDMDVGSLSEIVETPLGFHLINKTGEAPGGDVSFDDVREQVRDFLRHAKRGEVVAAYVSELKEKADIQYE